MAAWVLYLLPGAAKSWRSADAIAADAWPDAARDFPTRVSASDSSIGFHQSLVFTWRILRPLVAFGLAEVREVGGDGEPEFRLTPLYARVIVFDFDRAPSGYPFGGGMRLVQ